jgi:hypothetical protein
LGVVKSWHGSGRRRAEREFNNAAASRIGVITGFAAIGEAIGKAEGRQVRLSFLDGFDDGIARSARLKVLELFGRA